MSKYSEEVVQTLCEVVKAGNNVLTACFHVGIAESTFYEWQKEHPEFSEAIKKARAKVKQEIVSYILGSARNDWKAAAWWLERNYPKEYSLNTLDRADEEEREPTQIIVGWKDSFKCKKCGSKEEEKSADKNTESKMKKDNEDGCE